MNAFTHISAATGPQETTFPAAAVLTTATDAQSKITFAGTDFCDVTETTAADLVGAHHKIVRHPDMPRGVFHLMWDALKAEKPVSVYIKNRTTSGGYYWMLANVTVTEDGFLSARIQPKSELFETVKGFYAEMLSREAAGATAEESAAWLLAQLQDMGVPDMRSFGVLALDTEFKARGIVKASYEENFALMDGIQGLVADMRRLACNIETGFKRVRGEPVNLRILAGRLEGAGAALGTISQNYDAMAQEMYELLGRLYGETSGALYDMQFAVSQGRSAQQLAQLLEETAEREEAAHEDGTAHTNLRTQHARLERISVKRIREIAAASKPIPDICRSLRRRINGLDVVKLLCKVESGRMRDVDSGLDGIIERLQAFHDSTDENLAELSSKASQIRQKMSAE